MRSDLASPAAPRVAPGPATVGPGPMSLAFVPRPETVTAALATSEITLFDATGTEAGAVGV
jgi:hypothetical protein